MSNEDFRQRLSTNKKGSTRHRTNDETRQKLKVQYEYLISKESRKYMKYVMYIMGSEIEQEYPGVVFRLIERDKSETSHEKKREKVLQKDSKKERKIFDTLGCCLVIEHIPFGANIEHKLCQNHLIERAKKYTEMEETSFILKKTIKEYEELETETDKEIQEDELELKELEVQINESEEVRKKFELKKQRLERAKLRFSKEKEAHKNHIASIEKLIQTYKQQYNVEDKEANNALARHILNNIIDRPRIAKKLGITRIPYRSKVHDGGKSGNYIACHDSLTSSKIRDNINKMQEMFMDKGIENKDSVKVREEVEWIIEMQAMSIQNYKQTKKGGKAQHSKCAGKERILPAFGSTDEENNKFKDRVLKDTPRYMVYQSSIKNEDGTIRKGRVYVCSEIENVIYHFLEALENNPELFKHIVGRKDLFSDKSEIVTEYDVDI